MKALKRVAILSIAGAIAVSASTMSGPPAFAAAPSANDSGQLPPLQQKQTQKNTPGKQPQAQQPLVQQNGQILKNQPGVGQPPKNTQKVQKLNTQNGPQQTQQQKDMTNGRQVGQGSNQQPKNQTNGQPKTTYVKQRYDWSSYQPGHQPPQWQQHNAGFDPHGYQWNRTSNQRYHYQTYQRPRGWYPQHWTYGQTLPSLFWTQAYWLTGYYNFGLIDPPYGYVWVQNGADALLVNVQSGQILSVEYNVFYS